MPLLSPLFIKENIVVAIHKLPTCIQVMHSLLLLHVRSIAGLTISTQAVRDI